MSVSEIVVSGLCKRYGGLTVFENYSRRFAGQSVLMAPSGWGKTTLLRLMLGLEKPDAGRIEGVGRAAAVFQEDRLCPQLTAAANLRFVAPGLSSAEMEEALTVLALTGPDLTTPAGRLSGGQKRRVALLRALLAPGDALLLDEPFTGMDAALQEKALALVARYVQGKTAILVTHDAAAARALGWPVLCEGEEGPVLERRTE